MDVKRLSYPACRDFSHPWEMVEWVKAQGHFVERTLECQRCGLERIEVLDTRTGALDSRKYRHYAKDYLVRGEGRVNVALIRLETIKRLIQQARKGQK